MKIGDKINLKNLTENNILSKREVNGYKDKWFHKEDIDWIVFEIDGDEVLLISEKPTEQELNLKGFDGWFNSEDEINRLCREITGIETARSIDEKDLERFAIKNYKNYEEVERLIFGDNFEFWLASRCVYLDSDYAGFRVRYVGSSRLP